MKNIFRLIPVIALLGVLAVSCDYLDKREVTSGLTADDVFTDTTYFAGYVDWMVQNPGVHYLQDGTNPNGSFDDVTDNTMSCVQFTIPCLLAAQGDYLTMIQNGRSTMCNGDVWTRFWKHIRIANTGIKNIGLYPGSESGKNKILGTCYFYRAFAYFEICRRWGGMPYFTEPLDLADNLDYAREDMRTTYLKCADDFAKAAEYLTPTVPDAEWQHPTSVAALALRARCLVYAASKQATTEGDKVRDDIWEQAAVACDKAIQAAEDAGYGLVPGSDYYYIFKGTTTVDYTKEVLFGRRAEIKWGSDAYKSTIRPPGRLAGTMGVAANQTFVDCFDMANGYPVTDPKSGYNPQNPYINRGLRFNHDILYNQAKAFGGRFTMDLYHQAEGSSTMGGGDITYLSGEIAAGYTRTGTYAIKWMGKDWNVPLPQIWPYIRMAEVYLNFAEAAAEAGWDVASVHSGTRYSPLAALNLVRNRAGIANLPAEYQTADKFLERVKNERRVELCLEDHRFYDIRRWMIGTEIDENIYPVFITKLKAGYDKTAYPTGYRYEYPSTPVLSRIYQTKMNLYPIKVDDTYMGPLFTQNPGW